MANIYIFQLRRGVKDDSIDVDEWAEYEKLPNHIIPLAGELVLEYDNGIPRLKIGNGKDEFSALPYMSVDSFILPKQPTTINLFGGDAWTEVSGDRFEQDITAQLQNFITANSKIDLHPTPGQLCTFHTEDVAFTTVNEHGVVKVYAVGLKPQVDHKDIPITITEVVADGVIIGDTTSTPNPCPDWNQSDDTKADFIKNKPDVGALLTRLEGLETLVEELRAQIAEATESGS